MHTNTLVVTQEPAELLGGWLRIEQANWFAELQFPLSCTAKIRYRQQDQACTVVPAANGEFNVTFATPQRAIAVGQYAAFYAGDIVLGGGRISACEPLIH